ncbi:MAG: hypothetical protein QOG53_2181 [Frankiales bacterium]|nr:hypothetical protein [Frankiales bacterium]
MDPPPHDPIMSRRTRDRHQQRGTALLVRELQSVAYGRHMGRRSVDWLFRSRKTGKFTIAQMPNAPLALFVGFRIAQVLVSARGTAHDVLGWLAIAALAWWGLDELLRGVNPFRRILGAAALTSLIV